MIAPDGVLIIGARGRPDMRYATALALAVMDHGATSTKDEAVLAVLTLRLVKYAKRLERMHRLLIQRRKPRQRATA